MTSLEIDMPLFRKRTLYGWPATIAVCAPLWVVSVILALIALWLFAPAAHAQSASDPTGLLTALSVVPGVGPYLVYIPIVIALCKLVTVILPPPAAGSKLIGLYNVISAIGLNLGNARNAAPAGMQPAVRDAALASAAAAAANPAVQTIAPVTTVTGAAVIVSVPAL